MSAKFPTLCVFLAAASSLSAAPAVQHAAASAVQLEIALGGFVAFLFMFALFGLRRKARINAALRKSEHFSLHGVEHRSTLPQRHTVPTPTADFSQLYKTPEKPQNAAAPLVSETVRPSPSERPAAYAHLAHS